MVERQKRTFSHKELVEILVKHSEIHEGHWGLLVEFGLGAANVPTADSKGVLSVKPTAMVPVNVIGIQEFGEPTPITIDAATVNPHTPVSRKSSKPQKRVLR
jgi:hypothetical protein